MKRETTVQHPSSHGWDLTCREMSPHKIRYNPVHIQPFLESSCLLGIPIGAPAIGRTTTSQRRMEGFQVIRMHLCGVQRRCGVGMLWTWGLIFGPSLLLDSGVLADQQLNERTQQRFASLADIVHKLEETQVEREFLLGNAPMRAKPTPK
jgi:hypothetical protein